MTGSQSVLGPLVEHAFDRGILVGSKFIGPEDDLLLWPEEAVFFESAVAKVRRQSGAARSVARALFQPLGIPPCAIPKGQSGAPVWPPGVVGSLAHDSTFAIAAVAPRNLAASIGIDIEVNDTLAPELVDLIATPAERRRYAPHLLNSKLLFVVKEAVYKATFPVDGKFLDFQDVEVDLDRQVAHTVHGLSADIIVSFQKHLTVLAILN